MVGAVGDTWIALVLVALGCLEPGVMALHGPLLVVG